MDCTWRCLLALKELSEHVLAFTTCDRQVEQMGRVIDKYLTQRIKLSYVAQTYLGDGPYTLRVKHGYLLMYPALVRVIGPIANYNTKSMERRNGILKRNALRTRAFKHLCQTIGKRDAKVSTLRATNDMYNMNAVGRRMKMSFEQWSHLHEDAKVALRQAHLDLNISCQHKAATLNDRPFEVNQAIAYFINFNIDNYCLGVICGIHVRGDTCNLVVNRTHAVGSETFGIVKISQTSHYDVVPLSHLANHEALNIYVLDGEEYVSLRSAPLSLNGSRWPI